MENHFESHQYKFKDITIKINVSFGSAVFDKLLDKTCFNTLKRADTHMYIIKENKKKIKSCQII